MASNCPGCGRFARSYTYEHYDGTWNQITIVTFCNKCGTLETDCV